MELGVGGIEEGNRLLGVNGKYNILTKSRGLAFLPFVWKYIWPQGSDKVV
jgi:hypothetical protein